jgi:hypothetical protein
LNPFSIPSKKKKSSRSSRLFDYLHLFGQNAFEWYIADMRKEIFIPDSTGLLHGYLDTPENGKESYPLVIMLHGLKMSANAYPFNEIAKALQKNGFAVLHMDFAGHGKSEGLYEEVTVPAQLDNARRILRFAKRLKNIESIALLGHSQGGVVAALLAAENPDIRALVLLAPAGIIEYGCKSGDLGVLQFDPQNLPDYMPIFGSLLKKDYFETGAHLQIYESAQKYPGPVCIIQGTDDKFVPVFYARKFHEIFRHSRLYLLENTDHNFYRGGRQTIDLICRFLKRTFYLR